MISEWLHLLFIQHVYLSYRTARQLQYQYFWTSLEVVCANININNYELQLQYRQLPNDYQIIMLEFRYFGTRKVMFVEQSMGYICME
jgi:hypothetical protein